MTFENFTESVNNYLQFAVTIFKLDYAPRALFLQDFGENKPTIHVVSSATITLCTCSID